MAGFIRSVRPWVAVPVALVTIGALMLMAGAVTAEQPEGLHCPDGWVTKDESGFDDNDLVLDAGMLICVKAGAPASNETGEGTTGIIETDGVSTLREYLFAAGIVDGSGLAGRDVSYWVVYEAASPSVEASVPPSAEQSVEASVEQSVEASVPESPPASVPASVSLPASASPTGGELPGNPSPTGGTLPSTAVPAPMPDSIAIGLALMFLGSTIGAAGSILRRRA